MLFISLVCCSCAYHAALCALCAVAASSVLGVMYVLCADNMGGTAMYEACKAGHDRVVQLMVDRYGA